MSRIAKNFEKKNNERPISARVLNRTLVEEEVTVYPNCNVQPFGSLPGKKIRVKSK